MLNTEDDLKDAILDLLHCNENDRLRLSDQIVVPIVMILKISEKKWILT